MDEIENTLAIDRTSDRIINIFVGVLICSLAAYIFYVFRPIQFLFDSLYYVNMVQSDDSVFHPHHLFFVPIVSWIDTCIASVSGWDTILTGQMHSIFWGVVILACIYSVATRISGSYYFGFLAAFILFSTNAFLLWSMQTESYIAALGSFALIVAVMVFSPGSKILISRMLLLAAILSIGIFYHQVTVLVCLPLAIYLFLKYRQEWVKAIFLSIGVSGVFVLGVYIAVFASIKDETTFQGFINWIFYYAETNPSNWGTSSNLSLDGIKILYRSLINDMVVLPSQLTSLQGIGRKLIAGIIFGIMIWNMNAIFKRRCFWELRVFLLATIIIYLGFLLWWVPGLRQILLPVVFSISLLSAISLYDISKSGNYSRLKFNSASIFALIATILLFGSNMASSVISMHQMQPKEYLDAQRLDAISPEECAVLSTFKTVQNLDYYFNRNTYNLHEFILEIGRESRDSDIVWNAGEYEKCIVVTINDLKYFDQRMKINGYENLNGWVNFITWLYQLRHISDDEYRFVEPKIVSDDNDRQYLVFIQDEYVYSKVGDFQGVINSDFSQSFPNQNAIVKAISAY